MATNSGARRLVHNTRERILSSDHNREQSFAAAMAADAFRHLLDADANEEDAAGVATLGSASTNPMRAVVFNGLRVRPEIGTFNLFVDAGMGLFVDPGSPASPDDAPAQVVRSVGQQVAAALAISAPGGGTRIDVVECSVVQVVTETDNRDTFNQGTGTFTPQLVNKVVEAQLAFQVRPGTPGGGFPGTATGWLPLAVARVPSGAAGCDDCDFWDVRPLLSDFARGTHLVRSTFPNHVRQHASAVQEGAGNWRARGIVEAEYQGRRVGGNLAPTASGLTYLDLSSGGGLQEPGFAASGPKPWYLWLAFPFGLPRWAKYSPATSGARKPTTPRGVPIFSQKAPAGMQGTPASALVLPTATGLGGTVVDAVVALSGAFDSNPSFCGSATANGVTRVVTPGIQIAPTSGAGTASVIYNLTSNEVPPSATAVRLRFTTGIGDAAGDHTIQRIVDLFDAPAGNIVAEERLVGTASIPASLSLLDVFEVELPWPPNLPTGAATTRAVRLSITWVSGGSLAWGSQALSVVGWRLGG